MADHIKKRQKLNHKSVDGDDDDENSQSTTHLYFSSQRNALDVMFDGEVLLSEALPYLDTVSIVDKKIVSRQWKEKCDEAINSKGRQAKTRFDDNTELRDAVKRYCRGKRDEIENIAEEYGYPIGTWDVSSVEEFFLVFYNMETFNEDIGAWDVGNATNMDSMFYLARSFNQSLSGWDVSNVKEMNAMFCGASAFNGDVSAWNTSNVTDMGYMFKSATVFNRDISAWDTSCVTCTTAMFYDAVAFDGEISGWNVSRVTEMSGMFDDRVVDRLNPNRLNLIRSSWEKQGKRWW